MERWLRAGLFAGVLIIGGTACRDSHATPEGTQAAKLRALLEKDAKAAGKAVKVATTDGPQGLRVVTASIPDAYPGTGVLRVVLDKNGTSYGAHGERDIADLFRAQGWLQTPPPVATMTQIVNDALFEGLYVINAADGAAIQSSAEGLVLTFVRQAPLNGRAEEVQLLAPKSGKAQIRIAPRVQASSASGAAKDPAAELVAALAAKRFVDAASAVRALRGSTQPGALAALARATAEGNEVVATDALSAIGNTPDAAAALRSAWQSLPAARRAALLQTATELYGPGFSAQLK